MADETPGILAAAAARARRGGAGDAADRGDRRADHDREIGGLLSDRHRERQIAVAAQQIDAELPQIAADRGFAAVDQRDQDIVSEI